MTIYDPRTFPDSEALAMKIIKDGAITVGSPAQAVWVGSTFPGADKLPVVLVSRWGGVPVMEDWVDHPRLQIEAWAQHKSWAFDALDRARLELLRARGRSFNFGGGDTRNAVVSNVSTDLGATWQPDTVTRIDRYILGMAMVLHPLPA